MKSTALLFQDKTVRWLGLFSAIMVSNLAVVGYMADQTWPYFASVAGVSAHLVWQVRTSLPVTCEANYTAYSNVEIERIRQLCD